MSPLAYCTICFVLGVLAYPHSTPLHLIFPITLFMLSCVCHYKGWRIGFIISFSFLSFIGGRQWAETRNPLQNSLHISHKHKTNDKPAIVGFTVKSVRKPTDYSRSYIVDIEQLDLKKSNGLALLQLETTALLLPGEKYLTTAKIELIPSPSNPGAFDFAAYMKKKGVFVQFKSTSDELTFVKYKPTIQGYAHRLRKQLLGHIDNLGMRNKSKAVLHALVLGDRSEIDNDLQADYASAGAIHLLAISGLHVGVLMLILQSFFRLIIPTYSQYNRWVGFFCVTISLWGYAFLTGLSPSVLRAVTMFSFLGLTSVIKRVGLPLQQLWLSMITLILIKPSLVYEVGFQLSYSAVFGILWVMPKIQAFYRPKKVIFKRVWDLLILGCIAQLSTLPLSLYYFHQFPALFWVSNLVVIPFLGIILGAGLVGIIIAPWTYGASHYGKLLDGILHQMNQLIAYVAEQESFLVTNIPFDGLDATLLAALIFFLFLTLQKRTLLNLSILTFLSIGFHYSIYQSLTSVKELVILHQYKNTILISKNKKRALILSENLQNVDPKIINQYCLDRQVAVQKKQTLPFGFEWQNESLLIVDKNGIYDFPSLEGSIVLLRNNPKVHLDDLIEKIKPKTIVSDGSNFKSYVKRWAKTCAKYNVLLHDTAASGAYVLANP